MYLFFTLASFALLLSSLYLSSWVNSIIFTLILLTLVWIRFFSTNLIKHYFKKGKLIQKTQFHYLAKDLAKTFNRFSNYKLEIYVFPEHKNFQSYICGNKNCCTLLISESLLKHLSYSDLNTVVSRAGSLYDKNIYAYKQPVVAVFLQLTKLGRYVDTAISFVFGFKTDKGEPRPIFRRIIYFILDRVAEFIHIFYKSKKIFLTNPIEVYSYVNGGRRNPALKPLSIL